jgi:hypothetical protein
MLYFLTSDLRPQLSCNLSRGFDNLCKKEFTYPDSSLAFCSKITDMRITLLTAIAALLITTSYGQLITLPEGGNKKAIVGEQLGLTEVTITYNRPGVKGREGKIWGELIHTGFTDLGFGTSKSAPWRAGANENTVISFSKDVTIEGKKLPAGKYGFFVAYDPNACTLIFSTNHTSWGSYFYSDKDDALRITVKPVVTDKSVEWLKYEFLHQTNTGATIVLLWEKLMIPFKVETDYINQQLASFREELHGEKSFNPGWQSWAQAATFCVQNNVNLEEALTWSDMAISGVYIGEKNFLTLSTKAQLLNKMNRAAEADSLMKAALPMGTMQQLHAYGRQLLQQKKNKEAFDVFKINYDKNPNVFTTNMGMMRAWSANGDNKKALGFAQKAQPQAPDKNTKDYLEGVIKQLQAGKPLE